MVRETVLKVWGGGGEQLVGEGESSTPVVRSLLSTVWENSSSICWRWTTEVQKLIHLQTLATGKVIQQVDIWISNFMSQAGTSARTRELKGTRLAWLWLLSQNIWFRRGIYKTIFLIQFNFVTWKIDFLKFFTYFNRCVYKLSLIQRQIAQSTSKFHRHYWAGERHLQLILCSLSFLYWNWNPFQILLEVAEVKKGKVKGILLVFGKSILLWLILESCTCNL